MKLSLLIHFIILIFSVKCNESISGHGDCFSFSGYTYDAVDSSNIEDVNVCLTEFMGHFESPVSEECVISDSNGSFSLDMCPGYKVVEKWNGTEIYKLDSCKAVFTKNGYINDTVVIQNSDNNSTHIKNMYLFPVQN